MQPKTPKELFRSNPELVRRHLDLVDSREFRETLLVAFNEYCYQLPPSENPQSGWNANCKRQGAKEYMLTLLALADERRIERKPSGMLEPD